MSQPSVGRRERKKAATRQAIADAALRLFFERGYDRVSIRDIADAADVSTTTLFKHFSGKEALVFDQDASAEAGLIAAVRERPAGRSVPDALRHHFIDHYLPIAAHPQAEQFTRLIDTTPELRAYADRMWTRHTDSLSAAIAAELGAAPDDLGCTALARFVLDIPALTRGRPDLRAAVDAMFDMLIHGWRPPGTAA
ncbi:TetR/AcrR family transcriptional regulator [Nucisporomicrobium flavum]|uniref:TetR/AcrR family transcriptional regulator n=1 Tax=Nucisporomicrobium flavum TaxID=2785915 RepID=UPI0018F2FA44|nr:TetR/AcrR family transcriptional regulator [Nucisporomicrobium flavum]